MVRGWGLLLDIMWKEHVLQIFAFPPHFFLKFYFLILHNPFPPTLFRDIYPLGQCNREQNSVPGIQFKTCRKYMGWWRRGANLNLNRGPWLRIG
jgi:hypothetical protein